MTILADTKYSEESDDSPSSFDAEKLLPEKRSFSISLETVLYLLIFFLSILLHLWVLGDRGLHHDETHHSNYPWRLYTGEGYTHDPLLHGPFLYFLSAFFFSVFGDNDFTARLPAAVFGIILTVLPFLFRRQMGRIPALLTSLYLLISPVTLYVGRFIRHDIYGVVFEVLCILGIVRFIEERKISWIYLFAASFGLMVTNMESSYLFLVILATPLFFFTLQQINWKLLSIPAIFVILVVLAGAISPPVMASNGVDVMPLVTDNDALLIRNQYDDNWSAYFSNLSDVVFGHETSTSEGAVVAGRNGLFLHMWVPISLALGLLMAGLLLYLIFFRKVLGLSAWDRAVENAQPKTLIAALGTISKGQLITAFFIFFSIYTVFFTSFFFNTIGIVTGTTGSILYWVGQHHVERGSQPYHFYLVELFMYEPILLLWGFAGVFYGVRRAIPLLRGKEPLTAKTFLPPFFGWWAIASLIIYSWAGEKMPWLTIHVVVPMTFSGTIVAWAVLSKLFNWGKTQLESRNVFYSTLLLFILFGFWLTIIMASALKTSVDDETSRYHDTPLFLLLFVLATIVTALFYGLWVSLGQTNHVKRILFRSSGLWLLGITLLFFLYGIRSSWRLNYENGDIPVEAMVYVQTSPEVARVMDELEKLSDLQSKTGVRTANRSLKILYDNETIWNWYLRNYPNAKHFGTTLSGPPEDDVDIVLLYSDNIANNEAHLKDFVAIRMPMRWWFPEDQMYKFTKFPEQKTMFDRIGERFDETICPRNSLIDRLTCEPFSPKSINPLWKYMLYRDLDYGLGSVDFVVYVRPEFASAFSASISSDYRPQ